MYTYSYLVADIGLFALWALLFVWRRDTRTQMLFISIVFGCAGLVAEPVYILDWWHPLTFTHSAIGLEDFVFGFAGGGIAAIIYEEIFGKKASRARDAKQIDNTSRAVFLMLLPACFFGSFFLLGLKSFSASLAAFVPSIFLIWIYRKDLIADSILSGILMVGVGFLWFWLGEAFSPGWVQHYWDLKNLSGLIVLGVPLEDLLWGFLVGAYIGPLYEFWNGLSLLRIK